MYFTGVISRYFSVPAACGICSFGFGILNTIMLLIGWKVTRGYENTEQNAYVDEPVGIKAIIDGPLKLKSYRRFLVAFLCGIVQQTLFLGFMVYYLQNCVELSGGQIAIVNSLMWLISFLWVAPVNWFADRFSKKMSNLVSYGLASVIMIVFPFFIIKTGSVIACVIMCGLMTYELNGMYQIVYSYIPDFVDLDELKTGNRKEGTFYSCATITQKVFGSLAVLLLGLVLSWIGYDASAAVQSANTVNNIQWVFAGGCSVMSLLSVIFMASCGLDRKKTEHINIALKEKREGKDVNIDEFKSLF